MATIWLRIPPLSTLDLEEKPASQTTESADTLPQSKLH